jgi:hypothetical protein
MSAALLVVDPDELTPEQRLDEIAPIFARGCRRLAADGRLGAESTENSPEPPPAGLDGVADFSPCERTGSNHG